MPLVRGAVEAIENLILDLLGRLPLWEPTSESITHPPEKLVLTPESICPILGFRNIVSISGRPGEDHRMLVDPRGSDDLR